jgi:hypothetical protein
VRDYELYGSDIAKVLCRFFLRAVHPWMKYFTLDQKQDSIKQDITNESESILRQQSVNQSIEYY